VSRPIGGRAKARLGSNGGRRPTAAQPSPREGPAHNANAIVRAGLVERIGPGIGLALSRNGARSHVAGVAEAPTASGRDGGRRPMPPDIKSRAAQEPSAEDLARLSDQYFLRTKAIVKDHGDARVTYAVFLRRPVLSATRIAVQWLERVAAERGTAFDIELNYP